MLIPVCATLLQVGVYPPDNVFRIQGKTIKYFGHSQEARKGMR